MPITTLPQARAHEALALRIEAFAKQLGVLVARRPDAPVAPDTLRLADDLLFDAARFLHPRRRSRAANRALRLSREADTLRVSAAIGQARAALEAWELDHSAWSTDRKCFVWLMHGGHDQPVRRLRPQTASPREKADGSKQMRDLLLKRMDAKERWREAEGYKRGWADAHAGRPSGLDLI